MDQSFNHGTQRRPLNHGWSFWRLPEGPATARSVDLPHSPFVSDLEGNEPWFGVCAYERRLTVPPLAPGARLALHVGAARSEERR